MKIKIPIPGTVGKSVNFDPNSGARAEAAVAALAAQINAGLGANIRHSSLSGLQIGDDHPQYTGNQFPETITGQWNFQTIPFIQGETLAEYIEDVVGGSFFDFLQDTTSVVWTYFDTAQHLEANVPPEFVQDVVGAMLTDTASIDLAYNDAAGTFTASIIDEYVQDLVGAMLVDTPTVDFTYDDALGQISAAVPGAALSKVDDTNVTLTLGGTPLTALARAASLTLGWTGQLAVARGGSGAATLTGYLKGNGTSAFTASATIPGTDITGAALTKVDDTNVTLALGGTPATSLLRASSLTLGWTGQLAVPRGGLGLATVAQGDLLYGSATDTYSRLTKDAVGTKYLTNTGTSNNPAWAALPGSFSGFANPSASVGLAAVNGSATTAMRSDGAPALSQSIVPTWTGQHVFAKNRTGANEYAWQVACTNPVVGWNDTDGAADAKKSFFQAASTLWRIAFFSDDEATIRNILAVTRSGIAATVIELGNAADASLIRLPGDNQELQLGLSQDLRLYHDGTNSIIRNDTGDLRLNMAGTDRLTISSALITATLPVVAPAATTSIPSIRLPHGAAPSAPTNGDMWTTTAGLFVRINGATVGPLT